MQTVYRICKTKYANSAFDGEGAFRYSGRWNSRGVRMVYAAGSLALAMLEILVHLDDDELLSSYSFVAAQIPAALILPVASYRALPGEWDVSPPPLELQQLGDGWAREMASAILEVPTTIVPREKNYLLNPAHPDVAQIKIEAPERFVFDERLQG